MMCIDRELENVPTTPRAVLQCMYLAGCADWSATDATESSLIAAREALAEAERNYMIVEESGDFEPCLPALRAGLEAARRTITTAEAAAGEGF